MLPVNITLSSSIRAFKDNNNNIKIMYSWYWRVHKFISLRLNVFNLVQ